jgi:hypothetical protein
LWAEKKQRADIYFYLFIYFIVLGQWRAGLLLGESSMPSSVDSLPEAMVGA